MLFYLRPILSIASLPRTTHDRSVGPQFAKQSTHVSVHQAKTKPANQFWPGTYAEYQGIVAKSFLFSGCFTCCCRFSLVERVSTLIFDRPVAFFMYFCRHMPSTKYPTRKNQVAPGKRIICIGTSIDFSVFCCSFSFLFGRGLSKRGEAMRGKAVSNQIFFQKKKKKVDIIGSMENLEGKRAEKSRD